MTRKEAIHKLIDLVYEAGFNDVIFTNEEAAHLMDLIENELGMYPPMDNKGNFKWKEEGKKDGV